MLRVRLFIVMTFNLTLHIVFGGHIVMERNAMSAFNPETIADQFNISYFKKVFPGSTLYYFHHSNSSYAKDVVKDLQSRREIRYIGLQHSKDRDKRHFRMGFNDPYYSKQWYLNDISSPLQHDLNVGLAWANGWTGRGVVCAVLDDGIFYTNPDLAPNYEAAVSADLTDLPWVSGDPFPDVDDDSHGTNCAAIMAAAANNSYCGVGVAFDARVGGVRFLKGKVTDAQEAVALSHARSMVDVYSASWGPKDNGVLVDGPGYLAAKALKDGVTRGRDGRGAIYVWASGNGGRDDNCAMDGYASSLETFTVAALTRDGRPCIYSEPCASALVSVYVGRFSTRLTSDPLSINVVVPDMHGACTSAFQGTSAAASLAAGVIALVLQANPSLGWRDVQHLSIRAAKPGNGAGWTTNAAGFTFHEALGFGAMDAFKMVQFARNWKTVPQRESMIVPFRGIPCVLNTGKKTILEIYIPSSDMNFIEVVEVRVSYFLIPRGALEVWICSPAGTTSRLLTRRPNDLAVLPLRDWPLNSVHFWGESVDGVWRLILINHSRHKGELQHVRIIFHGYKSNFQSSK